MRLGQALGFLKQLSEVESPFSRSLQYIFHELAFSCFEHYTPRYFEDQRSDFLQFTALRPFFERVVAQKLEMSRIKKENEDLRNTINKLQNPSNTELTLPINSYHNENISNTPAYFASPANHDNNFSKNNVKFGENNDGTFLTSTLPENLTGAFLNFAENSANVKDHEVVSNKNINSSHRNIINNISSSVHHGTHSDITTTIQTGTIETPGNPPMNLPSITRGVTNGGMTSSAISTVAQRAAHGDATTRLSQMFGSTPNVHHSNQDTAVVVNLKTENERLFVEVERLKSLVTAYLAEIEDLNTLHLSTFGDLQNAKSQTAEANARCQGFLKKAEACWSVYTLENRRLQVTDMRCSRLKSALCLVTGGDETYLRRVFLEDSELGRAAGIILPYGSIEHQQAESFQTINDSNTGNSNSSILKKEDSTNLLVGVSSGILSPHANNTVDGFAMDQNNNSISPPSSSAINPFAPVFSIEDPTSGPLLASLSLIIQKCKVDVDSIDKILNGTLETISLPDRLSTNPRSGRGVVLPTGPISFLIQLPGNNNLFMHQQMQQRDKGKFKNSHGNSAGDTSKHPSESIQILATIASELPGFELASGPFTDLASLVTAVKEEIEGIVITNQSLEKLVKTLRKAVHSASQLIPVWNCIEAAKLLDAVELPILPAAIGPLTNDGKFILPLSPHPGLPEVLSFQGTVRATSLSMDELDLLLTELWQRRRYAIRSWMLSSKSTNSLKHNVKHFATPTSPNSEGPIVVSSVPVDSASPVTKSSVSLRAWRARQLPQSSAVSSALEVKLKLPYFFRSPLSLRDFFSPFVKTKLRRLDAQAELALNLLSVARKCPPSSLANLTWRFVSNQLHEDVFLDMIAMETALIRGIKDLSALCGMISLSAIFLSNLPCNSASAAAPNLYNKHNNGDGNRNSASKGKRFSFSNMFSNTSVGSGSIFDSIKQDIPNIGISQQIQNRIVGDKITSGPCSLTEPCVPLIILLSFLKVFFPRKTPELLSSLRQICFNQAKPLINFIVGGGFSLSPADSNQHPLNSTPSADMTQPSLDLPTESSQLPPLTSRQFSPSLLVVPLSSILPMPDAPPTMPSSPGGTPLLVEVRTQYLYESLAFLANVRAIISAAADPQAIPPQTPPILNGLVQPSLVPPANSPSLQSRLVSLLPSPVERGVLSPEQVAVALSLVDPEADIVTIACWVSRGFSSSNSTLVKDKTIQLRELQSSIKSEYWKLAATSQYFQARFLLNVQSERITNLMNGDLMTNVEFCVGNDFKFSESMVTSAKSYNDSNEDAFKLRAEHNKQSINKKSKGNVTKSSSASSSSLSIYASTIFNPIRSCRVPIPVSHIRVASEGILDFWTSNTDILIRPEDFLAGIRRGGCLKLVDSWRVQPPQMAEIIEAAGLLFETRKPKNTNNGEQADSNSPDEDDDFLIGESFKEGAAEVMEMLSELMDSDSFASSPLDATGIPEELSKDGHSKMYSLDTTNMLASSRVVDSSKKIGQTSSNGQSNPAAAMMGGAISFTRPIRKSLFSLSGQVLEIKSGLAYGVLPLSPFAKVGISPPVEFVSPNNSQPAGVHNEIPAVVLQSKYKHLVRSCAGNGSLVPSAAVLINYMSLNDANSETQERALIESLANTSFNGIISTTLTNDIVDRKPVLSSNGAGSPNRREPQKTDINPSPSALDPGNEDSSSLHLASVLSGVAWEDSANEDPLVIRAGCNHEDFISGLAVVAEEVELWATMKETDKYFNAMNLLGLIPVLNHATD